MAAETFEEDRAAGAAENVATDFDEVFAAGAADVEIGIAAEVVKVLAFNALEAAEHSAADVIAGRRVAAGAAENAGVVTTAGYVAA